MNLHESESWGASGLQTGNTVRRVALPAVAAVAAVGIAKGPFPDPSAAEEQVHIPVWNGTIAT